MLLNPVASFALAERLRSREGADLGDVFSFLSGLYFRGKLAYARAFARPPSGLPPAMIITTDRGLMTPEERVRREDLLAFSEVDIAVGGERYLAPLRRDVAALAEQMPQSALAILLGSIATGKYVDTLLAAFGTRLVFPSTFVGRGDMSRGGLLLRSTRSGDELEYTSVTGAVLHGTRPPKLERARRCTR